MRTLAFFGAGLLALSLAGALAPARAEIRLQKLGWELSRKGKNQVTRYHEASSTNLEGGRLPGRLRARLILLNRGPHAVEGILLRYSVAARLIPVEGTSEGVWAVPFMLGERRVPKVGPNQIREVPLEPSMLPLYLLKTHRAGFKPDQIRLQVMLEPRAGHGVPIQTLENALPILP